MLDSLSTFPIDRTHPPRQLVFHDDARELVLRPWGLDDVDALVAAVEASLAELRAFMPWAHLPITREGEYALVAQFQADYWAGRQYVFGMFDGHGRVLGGLGLHPRTPLNPRALEVGYWTRTADAKKGHATLAVRMAAVLAFDWFDCDRLQVMHDEANVASRGVIEKCGFFLEGTLRNATAEVSEQARRDGYRGTGRQRLYAITPEDLSRSLPAFAWLPAVRAGITVVDALGRASRA
jgi:RimJ/RimL family protein N-acetyltransferase